MKQKQTHAPHCPNAQAPFGSPGDPRRFHANFIFTASRATGPLIAVWVGLFCGQGAAQTPARDTTFNIGTGIGGSYVHALAINSEGKIVVGGNFNQAQGSTRNYLAQFTPDGKLDATFAPVPGPSGEVLAVACQNDGKVVIGGVFTRVNNTNCSRIARVLKDGKLDASFNPGAGANAEVRCVRLQADGKILIGGPFSFVGGAPRAGVARLNSDGTIDTSFTTGSGVGGERFLDEVRELGDGKIIIAGDFPTYNGVKRASIARLNSDGTLDASFNPGAGAKPGDPILGLALQPDNKILIAGAFLGFNGKPLNNIARLNPDGSVDAAFNPGLGTSGGPLNGLLQAVTLEPDGKILIGGWFDRVDRTPRACLARLLPGGTVDTNWNVSIDGQVRAVAIQPDKKVVFAGDFSRVANSPSSRLARLNASQPWPARFGNCHSQSDGTMCFEFACDPVRNYLLQVSDDLQVWRDWTNVSCAAGRLQMVDTNAAGHPARYYRALLQDL